MLFINLFNAFDELGRFPLFNFFEKFCIFITYNHSIFARNQIRIVMLIENAWVTSFSCWGKWVNIDVLNLLRKFFLNIEDPVSSHPRVPSVRFFEHILLRNLGNSVIVESPPFIVEPILNESVIMTWLRISVVHTNGLQMIRIFVKVSIGYFDLFRYFLMVLFHFSDLLSNVVCVGIESLDHVLNLSILTIDALSQRMIQFKVLIFFHCT